MLPDRPAFAYLRLSRALGDPDDPDLLAAHRSALLRQAQTEGVPLPPENIVEEIGSGERIAQRPRFQALLEQFERSPGSGGILYCVALDRLSRGSFAEVGRIMEALVHAGIEVRTPSRRYDLTQPDDELFYAFMAALSRHELGRYRARAKLKRDEMTRAGQIVSGGDRFGYRWDKNEETLVPVPEEFVIVQALFREALTESTYRLSARYGLFPDTIRRILRNPVYTGWPARHLMAYRWRNGEGKRGGRPLPPEEWLWPERQGTYPAAVTREQFDAVQEALTRRAREGEKTGFAPGWCRDVLQFEERPGARIELGSHLHAGGLYRTYTTRPVDGRRLYVDREIVHAAALPAIRAAFAEPALLAQALAAYEAAQQPATDSVAAAALQEELASLRRRHDELLAREVQVEDAEERASIARVRAAFRGDIESRKQTLRSRQRPAAPAADLQLFGGEGLLRLTEAFAAAWEARGEAFRRAVTSCLLARVLVRITPEPHPTPWRREVVAVEYAAWLAPFMF